MPGQTFTLVPIGVLHGDIRSTAEAPKNYDESERVGLIEIFPEYREGLEGVESGDTVVVLFWLHEARRDILRVHPRGDIRRPKRGVFATRSPVRPNPIGLSELKVLSRGKEGIVVLGVDVLDGTPVLDIKKRVGRAGGSYIPKE